MRKFICRLRLSEVSRQYPERSLYYGKTPTMIKFLHMQSPDAAHIFCQSHPVVDMEELLMVIDEVMWDIFDDVNFFFDEEYEATVVQCSHPIIDRLYEQGRASDPKHGSRQSVWSKKLHDTITLYPYNQWQVLYSCPSLSPPAKNRANRQHTSCWLLFLGKGERVLRFNKSSVSGVYC